MGRGWRGRGGAVTGEEEGERRGGEQSYAPGPILLRKADSPNPTPSYPRPHPSSSRLQSLLQVQKLPHLPPSHSRAGFLWLPRRSRGLFTLGELGEGLAGLCS